MSVRLLTPAARILLALGRAERPLSFGELEEMTGLHHASLDLNLKKLIAEGLIEKRGRSYVLTPSGKVAVESLIAEIIER